jgi:hypothetical protein
MGVFSSFLSFVTVLLRRNVDTRCKIEEDKRVRLGGRKEGDFAPPVPAPLLDAVIIASLTVPE